MNVRKIFSIVIVSVASLIVLVAVGVGIAFFGFSRSDKQQNFAPSEGQQAVSPIGNTVLSSKNSGNASFLYRKDSPNGKSTRLTATSKGIESEASFSHDGKLVVYSFAASPDSKSSIWLVGIDGSNPHAITDDQEDALHPVFSPDDTKVFYAASKFTGHHSPIARSARHEWDIFSVPVSSDAKVPPTQITHEALYDLQSVDAAKDELGQGGIKLLVSTYGYPIGALLKEFILDDAGRNKIFQPHVPGQSSIGPSYGGAYFINNGMDILFLAASDTTGGTYDYNAYSMSDVTGSEIKQLTHLKGMTENLKILPGGKATFVNNGTTYLFIISSQTVQPL